ncbi:CYTH domain-containing protein [Maribellus maritimus]|uniref:CYTH domain-containing protein n=1 Tax=Maribellus maritimus TaxID=2870838 RepID=UPI001EEBDD86|nr:CYTH domain-containing protein [Maribellus maritimus]MCG6189220.1 CYTH domain-containing protein [Maribellus maritimus]
MVEIERKFLVTAEGWQPGGEGQKLVQGYLSIDPERTVRVRIVGEKSFLTVKGKTTGITRTELEYEIPLKEGVILLEMCLNFPVEKSRFKETIGGLLWEIDVFEGANKGLILAEVELLSERQKIDIPAWVEKEVSGDIRFYNSYLSSNPFSTWKNKS